jgi:hypothetical protein
MYVTGYVLKTDADFDNMVLFMLPVEVYRGEELLFTGIMTRHSEFVTRFAPPLTTSWLLQTLRFISMFPTIVDTFLVRNPELSYPFGFSLNTFSSAAFSTSSSN